MDKLDFLDGDAPVDTTPADSAPIETQAPEPSTADTAPQAEGPARGADGKFVGKADTAPAGDASPQPPAPMPAAVQTDAKAPDGYVPVAALQAIREELNALKRQPQQPPQPAPDPYEDFEAYQAHQEGQRAIERANWSRQIAELKYDPQTVTAAQDWAAQRFDADPAFQQRALSSADPYGFAIEEYQRDQALKLLSDPKLLEQFRAWQAGTGPAPQAPQAAQPSPGGAPPQQSVVAPPPSITSAPSAGGAQHVPSGPGQAFSATFG